MVGYSGGCGTIGWSSIPYPYAYKLLTEENQKNMPLKQFEDSFKGIGHITLLKLYPTYIPNGTPENIRYHMLKQRSLRVQRLIILRIFVLVIILHIFTELSQQSRLQMVDGRSRKSIISQKIFCVIHSMVGIMTHNSLYRLYIKIGIIDR